MNIARARATLEQRDRYDWDRLVEALRVGQNARDFQHRTSMPFFSYANIYNHVEKTFSPSHRRLALSSQSLFLSLYIFI